VQTRPSTEETGVFPVAVTSRVGEAVPSAGRRRRSGRRRLLVALVAVVALGAAFVGGRSSVPRSPTTTEISALAVTECPTTYGSYTSGPTRYPARIALELPVAVASQLAFYSDATRSLQPVLGPAGWTCTVGVGADGTTGVDLVPPPSSTTGAAAAQPGASTDESVIVLSAASCQGCIYSEVCPYVRTAAQQLGFFEVTCPTARPPAEQITWLTGSPSSGQPAKDTVLFDDPPGVKGSGDGSGGTNPSQGVFIYRYDGPSKNRLNDGFSKETCTLPAGEGPLCTAIVGNFVDGNWLLAN